MNKLLLGLSTLVVTSGGFENSFANEPKTKELDYSVDCKVDTDCTTSPMILKNCFHFCQGEECTPNLPVCSVLSKNSGQTIAMCIWNAPCKKPNKITCENKICISH